MMKNRGGKTGGQMKNEEIIKNIRWQKEVKSTLINV